jgi:nifR3 family TIM-barrel protein
MSITIGKIKTRNRVFLAPMSGVSDEPFRKAAHGSGAGLVVSEMVASEELVRERRDMVRRAKSARGVYPFVMQIAGREAKWMAEGARVAQDLGADIIDINMGCPARQVTGGLSGSALMRNLDHAITLVAATVNASKVPVTLKMRLGWDEKSLNAPELARRAEAEGVAMITVHGRTRCQFYTGKADWRAIRAVREEIKVPLVANGDCASAEDARSMMALSGCDGVMIGRAAYGRPWLAGDVARGLSEDSTHALSLDGEKAVLLQQQDDTLTLYGEALGNKTFRKHLNWTIGRLHDRKVVSLEEASHLRTNIVPCTDNHQVRAAINMMFEKSSAEMVAA